MPAIITHYLFARKSLDEVPGDVADAPAERLAFRLGAQGPDPLFCRFTGAVAHDNACHRLAHDMHQGQVTAALASLRGGVSSLPEDDRRVGRAWALGMLDHYVLDSTAHPFVFAEQYALMAADEDLADAFHEVHAVIEADIDSWLLWREQHVHAEDGTFADEALARTEQVERAAGALVSLVAYQVYGIELDATQYGHAVRDYERFYHGIEPVDSLSAGALSTIELMARPHSQLRAMAHPHVEGDGCASANTAHHEWHDPSTGVASQEDFAQVMSRAQEKWPRFAQAFLAGEDLAPLVAGLNYDGVPMGPGEAAPER